jgi:hypothetical protein
MTLASSRGRLAFAAAVTVACATAAPSATASTALTHALPRKLHRSARIAWTIQSVPPARITGNAITIRHAVAYDKHGRVVGNYRPPRRR